MNPSTPRITRRNLMLAGAAAAATGTLLQPLEPAAGQTTAPAGTGFTPVVTPNGVTLAHRVVDGVKVFHLVAGEFDHQMAPGLTVRCWGYNGRTPGPTIEAVEGDRVRIYVTNTLPDATTIHWHGVIVPSGMDGVSGLSQAPIPPGQTFMYEFDLVNPGTHMYHSHHDEMVQIAMGMVGMLISHPKNPRAEDRVDRDFAIMLGEWRVDPGASRPNPLEMIEFNMLTMNSVAFPATEPLVAKFGDRVRIRFGNLGPMDHHPIHLHGYDFAIAEHDGVRIPESARWSGNTILVPVGSTRAVELVANNPGDWAMHCHMTHHTMNQMGHAAPNTLGVDAAGMDERIRKLLPGFMTMGTTGMAGMGEMNMPLPGNSIPMLGAPGAHGYIDMGGMFTVLKVRRGIQSYEDPGWYVNPPGTQASPAPAELMRRDGIRVEGLQPPAPASSYVCPMHPDVMSKEPGKCPRCGMNLRAKP